ncbi:MAG: IS200/IS605 family transposase [Nanoarchaeota archaeon]
MVTLEHACHKVYLIKYHLICIVKYRKDLFLNEAYVDHIKCVLLKIKKRYFLTPETIGFDEDHVHILMQAAPRYSPSRVMQIVKSITKRN